MSTWHRKTGNGFSMLTEPIDGYWLPACVHSTQCVGNELQSFNSWPTFSPYLHNRVSGELTTRNPLSRSRLACSRLSGHIQPSVNTTQHLNYNGTVYCGNTCYARVFHSRPWSNYNVMKTRRVHGLFGFDDWARNKIDSNATLNSIELRREHDIVRREMHNRYLLCLSIQITNYALKGFYKLYNAAMLITATWRTLPICDVDNVILRKWLIPSCI